MTGWVNRVSGDQNLNLFASDATHFIYKRNKGDKNNRREIIDAQQNLNQNGVHNIEHRIHQEIRSR